MPPRRGLSRFFGCQYYQHVAPTELAAAAPTGSGQRPPFCKTSVVAEFAAADSYLPGYLKTAGTLNITNIVRNMFSQVDKLLTLYDKVNYELYQALYRHP